MQAAPFNPALAELRKKAAADRTNASAQEDLVKTLVAEISSNSAPQSDLVLELVNTLQALLAIDPNHRIALSTMAEISFDQQIFEESVVYYQRYLHLAPDDLKARTRYASALTMVERPREAVQELEQVLAQRPNDFHAWAYLSIAQAELGNREQALTAGEKAKEQAPSDEARARFEMFLSSLRSPQQEQPAPPPPTAEAAAARQDAQVQKFAAYLQGNPVVGPKLRAVTLRSPSIIEIRLDSFPMSQMPSFAREKFMAEIRSHVREIWEEQLRFVNFVDQGSGEQLDQLDVLAASTGPAAAVSNTR